MQTKEAMIFPGWHCLSRQDMHTLNTDTVSKPSIGCCPSKSVLYIEDAILPQRNKRTTAHEPPPAKVSCDARLSSENETISAFSRTTTRGNELNRHAQSDKILHTRYTYGISTNVGFGLVIDDLDQPHSTVRRFELARTSMASWYVVFTKVTDVIVGHGPTELQKNRMRAAVERHCGKPCLSTTDLGWATSKAQTTMSYTCRRTSV